MLVAIQPDIEEVRRMAMLLETGFPAAALRIADALADHNRDAGDALRAELWSQVAMLIAERQAKPHP